MAIRIRTVNGHSARANFGPRFSFGPFDIMPIILAYLKEKLLLILAYLKAKLIFIMNWFLAYFKAKHIFILRILGGIFMFCFIVELVNSCR